MVKLTLAPSKGMNAHASWVALWRQLAARGWTVQQGPRGDPYYCPPGVTRGLGSKVRVDYFDSKLQVVRHLRDGGRVFVEVGEEEDLESRAAPEAGEAKFRRAAPTHSAGSEAAAVQPRPKRLPVANAKTKPIAKTKPLAKRKSFRASLSKRPAAKVFEIDPAADFWQVWQRLTDERGWTLQRGPRGDHYYCPPGVKRGPGFQNRLHYFDSHKQVLNHLRGEHPMGRASPTAAASKAIVPPPPKAAAAAQRGAAQGVVKRRPAAAAAESASARVVRRRPAAKSS